YTTIPIPTKNPRQNTPHNKPMSHPDSWEIIEGLKIGQSNVQRPDKHEGFMLKKRKWPLKGWHKRFFVLDNGMLKYSKSPIDIQKGKLHGCIDVGLSVMSIKKRARRIDLDTEEHLYHLKVSIELDTEKHIYHLKVSIELDTEEHLYHLKVSIELDTEKHIYHLKVSIELDTEKHIYHLKVSIELDTEKHIYHLKSSLIELSKLLQSLEGLQRTQSAPNFTDMQVTHTHTHLTPRVSCWMVYPTCILLDGVHHLQYQSNVWIHLLIQGHLVKDNVLIVFLCFLKKEGEQRGIPLTQQTSNESRLSMSESVSEFFDAQEVLLSASSSENEVREGWGGGLSKLEGVPNGDLAGSAFRNGRRPCLPAPSPDCSNINLWNILRNNIGKDLSKVSMPVELNEPLNTLQHMCEELEYTELLDRAADTEDPYERMAIMAAFVISGYSSTYYRAGSKPFNPLLGETYECIREDKGMCFIAEQVSHHPPISACHADSNKFTFLQDVRWKNKFWGKSMEILPIGTVNVILPSFGDHYEWNKVTTCVHNILSGRRWIEHYGEITVRNTKSSACICKLTFVKGNYWSSNVNEVQGFVMDQEGKVVRRLFGKWHEGLYCGVPPSARCIWRPGSMPTDYELYYGFTRFAIELNELCPEMQDLLPPTDARFRPDQRHLEEGNVEMAASEKQRIEDMQRTRRKWQDENDIKHEPRFFKKVVDANQRERWVTNNTYWELRKSPGFINMENPNLW
uniref:Oxysterol-binding protein n=1 Tax=Oncorhynchus mykiss TaxID=8022 RepID=A0A8K9XU50_ONCMY